jgi:ankyrin repeat protein
MEVQQSTDDIFKALMRSDTDAVKTFIINNVDLNAKNERGFTPLHIAALNGNDDLIRLMIDRADPNITDSDGLTPLHFATNEGYIECVKALIDHGADVHKTSTDAVYYVSNHIPVYLPGGRTPLHFAAERGYDDVALELLQRGAKIDAKDNDDNDPRTLALLNKQNSTAQLLHERQCPNTAFEPMTTEAIQIKTKQDHALRSERISQLEKAKKKQRAPTQCALYKPKQRHVTELSDEYFDPPFIQALHSNSTEALRKLMTEVCPGVFEFVLFTPHFCQELLAETEHYKQSGGPIQRPNSMNNYGLIFDHMSEAFRDMMHLLLIRYIRPLAAALFPQVQGSQLNQHHAFMVEYELGKDVKLDVHQDLSDVTLNVCLGRTFEGAAVYFEEPEGEWQPSLGRAVIHLGSHRHGTRPLTSGFRANLIVWCRHNAGAESPVY